MVNIAFFIENRIPCNKYFFVISVGLSSRNDFFFFYNILSDAGRKYSFCDQILHVFPDQLGTRNAKDSFVCFVDQYGFPGGIGDIDAVIRIFYDFI